MQKARFGNDPCLLFVDAAGRLPGISVAVGKFRTPTLQGRTNLAGVA